MIRELDRQDAGESNEYHRGDLLRTGCFGFGAEDSEPVKILHSAVHLPPVGEEGTELGVLLPDVWLSDIDVSYKQLGLHIGLSCSCRYGCAVGRVFG
jgi:hypothetical protein